MIPCGKLTDKVGRKRCFTLGLAVYGVGAVLSAAAPGLGVLILGNSIFEGVGTALLIPPVYILTTMLFTDMKSRAWAFGLISGMGGIGAATGPLIGGLITTAISWRPADQFDQAENYQQQDRDQDDYEGRGRPPEHEEQSRERHRPDTEALAVRVGPRTGPVVTPACSPRCRVHSSPDFNAFRVEVAVVDGPVRKAAPATTRPTTRSVRRAVLMNRTNVSNKTAAASLGSVLLGMLFR